MIQQEYQRTLSYCVSKPTVTNDPLQLLQALFMQVFGVISAHARAFHPGCISVVRYMTLTDSYRHVPMSTYVYLGKSSFLQVNLVDCR